MSVNLVGSVLGAYVNAHGAIDDVELDAVERLADIDVERRDAYWQGRIEERAAFKDASLAICGGADWRKIANDLDDVARARAYRAAMVNPAPRPGDFQGRRAQ